MAPPWPGGAGGLGDVDVGSPSGICVDLALVWRQSGGSTRVQAPGVFSKTDDPVRLRNRPEGAMITGGLRCGARTEI